MQEAYKYEPHAFNRKVLHWPYCSKCGTVMMKNEFSQWVQRVGCNAADHPSYDSQRAKTSPF